MTQHVGVPSGLEASVVTPNDANVPLVCKATASLLPMQVVIKGWPELLGEPQTS